MSEQAKLDKAADRIYEAARKDKGSGYAGIRVSAENRELQLYWQGVKPKPVEELLKSLRSSVKVVELPARYTRAALQAEVERILKNGDPAIGGKESLVAVGPREDGSGVSIGVSSLGKQKASLALVNAPLGTKSISAGIPLFVEKGEKATSISRNDEQAHAGAYMRSEGQPAGNRCTTGFTIDVNDFARSHYMLTADHCVSGVGDSVRSASNGWFGGVKYRNQQTDLAIVAASNTNFFDPYMWFGTWTGAPEYQSLKPVRGARRSYAGDYVCTSGAASGGICNIQVEATGRIVYSNNGMHTPMVVARQLSPNSPAAGPGDSGGPVFSFDGETTMAKGIMSNGVGNVPCQGHQNRTCFSTLHYLDIEDAVEEAKRALGSPWVGVSTG